MDVENPVVALCMRGMRAEAEGRADEARRLFVRAWESAGDDYDACVAAHYLARQQSSPEETLRWNRECLDRADRVGDGRVAGFYASLHLNMAKSYGELADGGPSHEHYVRAAEHIDAVPEGQYRDWMRFAIAEGLRAEAEGPAGGEGSAGSPLSELVTLWCARAELKALGLVLPAHLGNLGTAADRERLVLVLRMVHAGRWLPEGEQVLLERAMGELERVPASA
ncbi:hypothetical protein ACH4SP_13400 [Streptomyces sp. NPDC021093]|uniref:hypothetical protein n=1 Tax=Streptomyces sp. NPDC021093 TaxID=3365112 RepID=UPI0037A5DD57